MAAARVYHNELTQKSVQFLSFHRGTRSIYLLSVCLCQTSPSLHVDGHRLAPAPLVPRRARQLPTPLSLPIRSDMNGGKVALTYNGLFLRPCLCEHKRGLLRVEAVPRQPFWVTWQHINSRLLILLRLICVEAFRVHTSTHHSELIGRSRFAEFNSKMLHVWSWQNCSQSCSNVHVRHTPACPSIRQVKGHGKGTV